MFLPLFIAFLVQGLLLGLVVLALLAINNIREARIAKAEAKRQY